MENQKFTKGKWEVSTNNEIGILITSKHPQNRDILTIWKYDVTFSENQEAKANALLISKAPEMLEMLKKCNQIIKTPDLEQLIKEATEI